VPQAGVLEQDGTVYAGTVAYNVDKLDIIATATHPNARVVKILDGVTEKPVDVANSVSVQVDAPGTSQSKTITVQVSAEDGTPGNNTINIFKDGSKIVYYATGGIVNLIKKEGEEDEYYEIHTFMFNPAAQSGGQTEYMLNFTQKPADKKVEVLVVAGGGGGGKTKGPQYRAGGGGAGGFLYYSAYDISDKDDSFVVKVGAGGAAATNVGGGAHGSTGGNSTFGSDFTANGGGGGGSHGSGDGNTSSGDTGGSGGGGTSWRAGGGKNPGTAPEGALNLGSEGSTGAFGWSGGGGGGAGGAGETPTGNFMGANGGSGTLSAISGASSWYAGGGAGGAEDLYNNGDQYGAGHGNSGAAGTGDGGSGGGGVEGRNNGGDGGSGIVIVRWPWIEPPEIIPEE
jgi:hypothetical protein